MFSGGSEGNTGNKRVKNLAKLLGKQLQPATLLKKRLWYSCFPVNFAKCLRTNFSIERLWWLLLK